MTTRDGRRRLTPTRPRPAWSRWLLLARLALGAQAGCGREFFRDWANQDVSEAVFEKSRDPRWRIDLFSVEPPALARHSNPYDPDRPPAPPDDRATEALAPVPQWPDNRLLVPAEGTGYLDMLEAWQRQPYGPSGAPGRPRAAAELLRQRRRRRRPPCRRRPRPAVHPARLDARGHPEPRRQPGSRGVRKEFRDGTRGVVAQ